MIRAWIGSPEFNLTLADGALDDGVLASIETWGDMADYLGMEVEELGEPQLEDLLEGLPREFRWDSTTPPPGPSPAADAAGSRRRGWSTIGASIRITRWAYAQVAREGGQVWVKGNELVRLGREWEGVM